MTTPNDVKVTTRIRSVELRCVDVQGRRIGDLHVVGLLVDVDDVRVAIAELCEQYDQLRNPNAVEALGRLADALPNLDDMVDRVEEQPST